MNWQPIETAPLDGTRILLANSKFFSAGHRAFRVEEDWTYLGYDEGIRYPDGSLKIGDRFSERVPNPDAGKRHEWWHCDNPCAFLEADEQFPDYDRTFEGFEPTHWAPCLTAPTDPALNRAFHPSAVIP
jgi:hypothetical protein